MIKILKSISKNVNSNYRENSSDAALIPENKNSKENNFIDLEYSESEGKNKYEIINFNNKAIHSLLIEDDYTKSNENPNEVINNKSETKNTSLYNNNFSSLINESIDDKIFIINQENKLKNNNNGNISINSIDLDDDNNNDNDCTSINNIDIDNDNNNNNNNNNSYNDMNNDDIDNNNHSINNSVIFIDEDNNKKRHEYNLSYGKDNLIINLKYDGNSNVNIEIENNLSSNNDDLTIIYMKMSNNNKLFKK